MIVSYQDGVRMESGQFFMKASTAGMTQLIKVLFSEFFIRFYFFPFVLPSLLLIGKQVSKNVIHLLTVQTFGPNL